MFCCILQLSEDPVSYIHELVVAPGGTLSGRGNVLVHLNNMVFRVVKGNFIFHGHIIIRVP